MAHATPTALNAILYGTATTVFPWFLMFPSKGKGWLGRDARGDAHLARVSLFNHIIFGLGIALWVTVMRPSEIQLLPSPDLQPTVIPSDT